MSRQELSTVFSINVGTDVKWCIYDALWKHIYPIDPDIKVELLDRAMYVMTRNKYKLLYESIYDVPYEFYMEGSRIMMYNRTNPLDAMLYDMVAYSDDDNTLHEHGPVFSYTCHLEMTDPPDQLNVSFSLQSSVQDYNTRAAMLSSMWEGMAPKMRLFVTNNISALDLNNMVDWSWLD